MLKRQYDRQTSSDSKGRSTITIKDLVAHGLLSVGSKLVFKDHIGIITKELMIEYIGRKNGVATKKAKGTFTNPTAFTLFLGDKSKRGWEKVTTENGTKLTILRKQLMDMKKNSPSSVKRPLAMRYQEEPESKRCKLNHASSQNNLVTPNVPHDEELGYRLNEAVDKILSASESEPVTHENGITQENGIADEEYQDIRISLKGYLTTQIRYHEQSIGMCKTMLELLEKAEEKSEKLVKTKTMICTMCCMMEVIPGEKCSKCNRIVHRSSELMNGNATNC